MSTSFCEDPDFCKATRFNFAKKTRPIPGFRLVIASSTLIESLLLSVIDSVSRPDIQKVNPILIPNIASSIVL